MLSSQGRLVCGAMLACGVALLVLLAAMDARKMGKKTLAQSALPKSPTALVPLLVEGCIVIAACLPAAMTFGYALAIDQRGYNPWTYPLYEPAIIVILSCCFVAILAIRCVACWRQGTKADPELP